MSLFSNLLGGGGPNVSGLQKKQSSLIDRGTKLYETLLGNLQTAEREGAWDPNVQLDQLKSDTEYGTKVASGNSAAAARTLGYKPGDSEPVLAQKDMGEKATLNYDSLANQIRSNALTGRLDAYDRFAGVGGSLLGQGINAYGDQIHTGLAQQAQSNGLFGNLLGTVMPFLGPKAATAPVTGASWDPNAKPRGYTPGNFFRF